jgi:aryl carrier-like protein
VVVVLSKKGEHQLLLATMESSRPLEGSNESNILLPPTDDHREKFDLLRSSLLEVLPAYMVPNIFVPVRRLLLNLSSKPDRRATQEMIDALDTTVLLSYAATKVILAPSTETERQLQLLWNQVLGMDLDISTNDHFLHIGDDSVGAMRVVAAARNTQLRLSVADIFQHPVLSELAFMLDNRTESDESQIEITPFGTWKEAIGM